jgi:hypothetical protein
VSARALVSPFNKGEENVIWSWSRSKHIAGSVREWQRNGILIAHKHTRILTTPHTPESLKAIIQLLHVYKLT